MIRGFAGAAGAAGAAGLLVCNDCILFSIPDCIEMELQIVLHICLYS